MRDSVDTMFEEIAEQHYAEEAEAEAIGPGYTYAQYEDAMRLLERIARTKANISAEFFGPGMIRLDGTSVYMRIRTLAKEIINAEG